MQTLRPPFVLSSLQTVASADPRQPVGTGNAQIRWSIDPNSQAISTDILEFRARVLVIQAAGAAWKSDADSGHSSARLLGRPRDPLLPGSRLPGAPGPRVRMVGRRSAVGDHAAASIDGHVRQAADRLASTRARRAAATRVVRSAGTASPVPKYISSGVCPRNAEWGSTRLCSWT